MSLSQALRTLTHGLLALAISLGSVPRAPAAEQLLVRFSGLELPLDLNELESWALRPKVNAELGPWLNLLDPATRQDLQRILRQPLNLESSTIALLLDSWAGRQLVLQLGSLLRSADGDGGPLLLDLLQRRGRSTVVSLLKEAPTSHLELDLDALSALGFRLRGQLEQQKNLLKQLNDLRLMPLPVFRSTRGPVRHQQRSLAVEHREAPLALDLWWPAGGAPAKRWLLFSHGLGGSTAQMEWLASELAAQGWPVLAVQHPGSDDTAVRGLLEGRQTLPGLETLPARLQDLQALQSAVRDGRLGFGPHGSPPRLVLLGHSLGALSSLLWAGADVEPGLAERCSQNLQQIPVLDSSFLLQCQLTELSLPALEPPVGLDAVVVLNSFGSLLWGERGLASIAVPVLSIGGSMDLITPPLNEQVRPFQQLQHSGSRLALVEGGSHFSAVGLR
ncbi:MAG TPA: alpha/beta hydrolase, partial [Synechococcales bacterium UBA8647]|nr:alpha/beta hydrolase [Synechococcales bacterium UBA8647]